MDRRHRMKMRPSARAHRLEFLRKRRAGRIFRAVVHLVIDAGAVEFMRHRLQWRDAYAARDQQHATHAID